MGLFGVLLDAGLNIAKWVIVIWAIATAVVWVFMSIGKMFGML